MADNVTLNSMTGGPVVAADEVTDGTLGTVKVQYVKLMDGTIDGTSKAVVSSAGLQVIERGTTIAHGTVSVATTSTEILSASATRRSAAITNTGSNTIWLGSSGITTSNGLRLSSGATAIIDKAPTAAIFGIAETATTSVAFFTESD